MNTTTKNPTPLDMFLMQTSNPSMSYICPCSLRVLFALPLKAYSSSSSTFPFPIPNSSSSTSDSMADSQHQNQPRRPTAIPSDKAPSTTQLLALLTLLPIGAFLLFLAGISFIGTVIGLAFVSPLFVIFSPILAPAAVVIALAVAGFLTSGAFGVTALSSLSWMANTLRRSGLTLQLEQAKQWVRETAAQEVQTKAQSGRNTEEVGSAQEGGSTEQGGQAQEGGTTQEKGTAKDESAQEGSKAQEGGKAQEGEKVQGGKARGGKK